MKKLLGIMFAAALTTGAVASDVTAQTYTGSPTVLQYVNTKVAGTINVPAPPGGALSGFACGNLAVTATSKDHHPVKPGQTFSAPKWTRTVKATGTYSSGKCSYSIGVPSKSDFFITANGEGNYACHYVATWIGSQGAAIGPIQVPLGTTRTQNFTISKVSCEFIH